jgi:hypothetical protein
MLYQDARNNRYLAQRRDDGAFDVAGPLDEDALAILAGMKNIPATREAIRQGAISVAKLFHVIIGSLNEGESEEAEGDKATARKRKEK